MLTKNNKIEIQSIISAVQNGDQTAFKKLYQQYAGALYGIIVRIVKTSDDSEEILQTVFLKIWNNIDSYNEEKATLYTWMAQIAKNTAIDRVRLISYQNASSTDSISERVFSMPDQNIEKTNDIDRITKKLPEKYKILLDKMFLEGYTQQEISDELSIPLGTVKTRLRDAIQILRTELQDERHLLYIFSFIG